MRARPRQGEPVWVFASQTPLGKLLEGAGALPVRTTQVSRSVHA
jgi:hypothetical protein